MTAKHLDSGKKIFSQATIYHGIANVCGWTVRK